ncbi:hypothetical protein [Rhizobium sp. FKL33]|uniref:hypothetical protein n=1 Tax=Rhizobium sp. FKL33 TaxID=2562307 RepID=UPI0010C05290|nr:hypothetical protein [Rhizobium sp. FKL33]
MPALDASLMERAVPHFCDAFVTFDNEDRDLVTTAQAITSAAKMAGFSKRGRRRILEYLYGFIDTMAERGIDPFRAGKQVDEPDALFSMKRLGGLFDVEHTVQQPLQSELFEPKEEEKTTERALIDQLIAATRLYDSSEAIQELLDFTARLREFAPFNAMLLHIQKPGLTHAATAHDWWHRFGRVDLHRKSGEVFLS